MLEVPVHSGRVERLLWAIVVTLGMAGGQATPEARPTYFSTLEPGATLPSGAACADRIRRTGWESRPENRGANHTRGIRGVRIDGADAAFQAEFGPRLDGDFLGTTDQIIRWGACKWGFDEDITRARAVEESQWRQSHLGDQSDDPEACALIGMSAPCWTSYGVLQVKATVHRGTYPVAKQSTPFNVDYALAWQRACYEGAFGHWLGGGYGPGDEWGCVGAWFSGKWYDPAARRYIERVRRHLAGRAWERPDF
jgi:autotransporter family porin